MTTGTRRKVRADAKLERLTAEQHAQLISWLDVENCPYTEAVARVRDQFGVSVGRTAMFGYYQRHVAPLYRDAEAEAVAALLALPEAQFDAAAVNQAKWLAWSALVNPQPQINTATKLLNRVRRAERKAIALERLKLKARLVALREKSTSRPTACPSQPLSIARPMPESRMIHPSPLNPVAPEAAPMEVPRTDAESASPATLPAVAPSQKISQHPPLYSPYSTLNQPLISVSIPDLFALSPQLEAPAQTPELAAA